MSLLLQRERGPHRLGTRLDLQSLEETTFSASFQEHLVLVV